MKFISKNKIVFFAILFLTLTLQAKNFTVASYNVENLFDMQNDGTEYKEFKPNTKNWNKKTLSIKLNNISQVLNDMDADIIGLEEIETKKALDLLLKQTPKYKYSHFTKSKSSAIGIAIISKYPIVKTSQINIQDYDGYFRPILEADIKIENKPFKVFVNHWRSKRAKENERIKYAISLQKYIFNHLQRDEDYIILGDFNSNYNEFITFKDDKTLNNTYGLTGINDILKTTKNNNFILKDTLTTTDELVHYNLWLDLPKNERFSYKFKNNSETPDNIILPYALFDSKNISYVNNSFKVFKPPYLYKNGKIQRWYKYHGYSDHLPVLATFTTDIVYKHHPIKTEKEKYNNTNTIKSLYSLDNLPNKVNLNDVVVIYHDKNSAIIKRQDDRAIYLFNCAKELKLGFKYNLTISNISYYNNLLEVKQLDNIEQLSPFTDYKKLYLDADMINILDKIYINDIVTNLVGIYKNHYLYLKNGNKIRLYFPKNFTKPHENGKISINSGHIGIFKGQMQILIHNRNDITND